MKKLFIVLALGLGLVACQDTGQIASVQGSFYVVNPWDSNANNIQSVVDTLYQGFRIDTINPTDSVDAPLGFFYFDTLDVDSLWIKADTGTGGWLLVK